MNKRYAKLNDKVYLVDKTNGNIIFLKDENMIIKTTIDQVEFMPGDYILPVKKKKTSIKTNEILISNEIMLRHMTKDEAILALDRYIDQALVQKLGRIKIIHGRHGEVLKKAVHEYLANSPYVESFDLASYGEGDVGVTIAILKAP